MDYAAPSVSVLWKGAVPAEVSAMDGQRIDGVSVTVGKAKFSEEELVEAGKRIFENEKKRGTADAVSAVIPNNDRSGVTVEVVSGTEAARNKGASAQRYTELTAVPAATTVVSDAVTPLTRQNDSAPWQGGGAIADSTGDDYCSTGFAILLDSGAGRLLSAAHCSNVGATIRDGVGQVIGPVSAEAPAYDALLIDPSASPATIGKVFGGPWNASTSHSRYQFFVGGAAAPAVGQTVCTSGARSGEHCGRTIRETGVTYQCNGTTCTGFRARGDGDGVSAAGGDSGGPIYDPRDDGRMGARGIISAGTTTTACGSVAEPTTCYVNVYGISITRILDRFGARIET